jgi:hypothetical protein
MKKLALDLEDKPLRTKRAHEGTPTSRPPFESLMSMDIGI